MNRAACLRGYRVRFALAGDLVNDLVASQNRNTCTAASSSPSPDALLIDEVGYLSFDCPRRGPALPGLQDTPSAKPTECAEFPFMTFFVICAR